MRIHAGHATQPPPGAAPSPLRRVIQRDIEDVISEKILMMAGSVGWYGFGRSALGDQNGSPSVMSAPRRHGIARRARMTRIH